MPNRMHVAPNLSAELLTPWILAQAASLLQLEPERLRADRPLSDFGLDSVRGIALIGDLEELIGRDLDPDLLWDHPAVNDLVAVLTGAHNGEAAGG
ncbi:acyl carrier protein [Pilimelia columellifera]|uniref:Carrier domain-containing protein n=1 Tax=Pilimelia columellifera subsp. columellifera TaxID=706583 RepID=A0ABN3NRT7_9ACTN